MLPSPSPVDRRSLTAVNRTWRGQPNSVENDPPRTLTWPAS
jgi:hypothetical protein